MALFYLNFNARNRVLKSVTPLKAKITMSTRRKIRNLTFSVYKCDFYCCVVVSSMILLIHWKMQFYIIKPRDAKKNGFSCFLLYKT